MFYYFNIKLIFINIKANNLKYNYENIKYLKIKKIIIPMLLFIIKIINNNIIIKLIIKIIW